MEIRVPQRTLDVEQLWRVPDGCDLHPLVSAIDGSATRLRTQIALYRDAHNLYVLFVAEDDHLVATMYDRDAPLYEEDVVEVFIAPSRTLYYEFEVSPLGTLFDARIESPDGSRTTMRVDRSWSSRGFLASVQRDSRGDGNSEVKTLITLPLADMGLDQASECHANFYRIDRHPRGDDYSAWSPTMRRPADFHVPASFGRLLFV